MLHDTDMYIGIFLDTTEDKKLKIKNKNHYTLCLERKKKKD